VQPTLMTKSRRSSLVAYGVALATVTTAAIVRVLLDGLLGTVGSNMPFLLAVTVTAWYGGLKPGVVATGLSILVALRFYVEPADGWRLADPSDGLRLLLFLISSLSISAVCESLHRARRRLEHERTIRETGDAFHRAISDLSSDFAYRAHVLPDGSIVPDATTGGFTRVTGFEDSDFKGRNNWVTLIHPADRPRALESLRRVLAGESTVGELRIRTKNGRVRWLHYHNRPVRDETGRIVQIYGAAKDITGEMDAEEKRRASEERERVHAEQLEKILSAVPAMILIATDKECRNIVGSRFSHELLGVPTGENLSLSASPGDRPTQYRIMRGGVEVPPDEMPMQQAARGIERTSAELEIQRADGGRRYLYGNTVSLRDPGGDIRGAVGAFVDVTALKDADRRKEEFLATLAHELRNPLAPIRNAAEILGLRGPLPPELQEAREVILRQVKHMVHLVNDLLDMSRISRNELQLRKEPVELQAVMHNAVETSRPLIEASHHRLAVSAPATPLIVDADPTRLAQVISNLLNNAAKFTPAGGDICLTASRRDGEAIVTVRDSGIGIVPEHQSRIFDMFSQLQHPLERPEGGLGIGLSLVRRVMELHGGSVGVKSEGLGRGSEFTVRLSVTAGVPAAISSPKISAPDIVPPPESERSGGGGSRVLVVDDNRDAADSLVEIMRLSGNEAEAVYDGRAALDYCATSMPDVVLLDIGLPGLNGYEVAERIRAMPNGSELLLIAVTGWGKDDDRRRSHAAGFDHHLVKPVDPAVIETLLSRHVTA
jgi:PAS domain S-box-containing protein